MNWQLLLSSLGQNEKENLYKLHFRQWKTYLHDPTCFKDNLKHPKVVGNKAHLLYYHCASFELFSIS